MFREEIIMPSVTIHKTIPMKKMYDVIVCGGGVAGVAAAVTAAKNQKSHIFCLSLTA